MNKKAAVIMCAGAESLALARAIAGAECPMEHIDEVEHIDPADLLERVKVGKKEGGILVRRRPPEEDAMLASFVLQAQEVFEDTVVYKDPGPRWNSNGKAKKRPWAGSSR